MDPDTGHIYSPAEIPTLPKEVQERLIPVPPPRPVKRNKRKPQKGKTYDLPSRSVVDKRRAANKVARRSRKKNR